MSGRPYDLRVVECWPEGLAAWLRRSAAERPLAPPHFAGCLRRVATGGTPEILSPNARETYVLMDGPLATQRIPLKSAGAPPRLYWFVDGAHVAESAPFETVFWPARKGRHRIACADDHGRTASVTIEVR
jgi:membrane carboxypeptidase/penicillin-binding protein PbpC